MLPLWAAVGFAAIAALAGLAAWRQARAATQAVRDSEARRVAPIKIVLVNEEDGREVALPYCPPRFALTRQEIAGALGMFTGSCRFELPELERIFRDGSYAAVLAGERDVIVVPAPPAEWCRFRAVIESFR